MPRAAADARVDVLLGRAGAPPAAFFESRSRRLQRGVNSPPPPPRRRPDGFAKLTAAAASTAAAAAAGSAASHQLGAEEGRAFESFVHVLAQKDEELMVDLTKEALRLAHVDSGGSLAHLGRAQRQQSAAAEQAAAERAALRDEREEIEQLRAEFLAERASLGREREEVAAARYLLERALPEQAAARIQAQLRAMGARHEASARRREKAAAVHVADAAAERAAAARVACVVDWQRKVAATVGQRYARGWLARRARGELYTTAGARTAAAQKGAGVARQMRLHVRPRGAAATVPKHSASVASKIKGGARAASRAKVRTSAGTITAKSAGNANRAVKATPRGRVHVRRIGR